MRRHRAACQAARAGDSPVGRLFVRGREVVLNVGGSSTQWRSLWPTSPFLATRVQHVHPAPLAKGILNVELPLREANCGGGGGSAQHASTRHRPNHDTRCFSPPAVPVVGKGTTQLGKREARNRKPMGIYSVAYSSCLGSQKPKDRGLFLEKPEAGDPWETRDGRPEAREGRRRAPRTDASPRGPRRKQRRTSHNHSSFAAAPPPRPASSPAPRGRGPPRGR